MLQKYPPSKYDENTEKIIGTITDFQIKDGYTKIFINGKEKLIINYSSKQTFKLGQKIIAYGSLKVPKENTTWNLFNYRKYLLSLGIKYTFTANKIKILPSKIPLIYQIKNKIITYLSTFKSKEHMMAFILGNDDYIAEEIKDSYQKNGLTHLLAISGMNITLIAGIILKISNYFLSDKLKSYLLVFSFLIFYLFLTGLTPSVLRATFLFILLTINKQFNLKIKTIYLLVLIFSILLFLNPYYLYNLGFLLSFIISFYLILFSKIISFQKSFFRELIVINIIAFLSSLPLLISNFFSLNLLSPFLNCLFTPLVSLLIYPLSLIAFFIKPLDNLLYHFLILLEEVSLIFSKIDSFSLVLCHLPLFFYFLYYVLITFIIYKLNNQKYIYIILIIPVLLIHHNLNYLNPYTTITMIDVGQGDSILIKLKHNLGNILIDTGGEQNSTGKPYNLAKNVTIPYLKSEGISKLDYLILTHGDFDHAGMAENLLTEFPVSNIITNKYPNGLIKSILKKAKKLNIKTQAVSIKTMYIGHEKFEFLNGLNPSSENNSSLIIYTNLEGENILLMGDGETEVENYLLNTYNLPQMSILKVGHHGSKTGSSQKFINCLKPRISLISAGQNNIYSHPHKETLKRLKNSHIYVTKDDGSVKINLTRFHLTSAR